MKSAQHRIDLIRPFSLGITLFLVNFLGGCSTTEETPLCPPNYVYCEGYCYDRLNDINHCGGCGQTCLEGETCARGLCEMIASENDLDPPPMLPMCSPPLTLCGEECINLQNNAMNCGRCSASCQEGQLCVGGLCSTITEGCNGVDDDEDGRIDEGIDGGILKRSCSNPCGEGEEVCSSGAFVNCSAPEAELEVCDTLDNDCDGVVDEEVTNLYFQDSDGDSFGSPELSLAQEACSKPQGYSQRAEDCDDENRDVNPAALEVCDSIDNNCDGTTDEGCQCTDGEIIDCGSDIGICASGTQVCQLGQLGVCGGSGYVPPEVETCDGLDNDCDGSTDEDLMSDLREGGGNSTCNQAHLLPSIDDGDQLRVQDVNLYSRPGGEPDVDWYRVLAREANDEIGLGNIACLDNQRQCYAFFLNLTPPEDLPPEDIIACITLSGVGASCGSDAFRVCTHEGDMYFDAESGTYRIGIKWPGVCIISDDSREFTIEVRGRNGNINSCYNYRMKLEHVRLPAAECPEG